MRAATPCECILLPKATLHHEIGPFKFDVRGSCAGACFCPWCACPRVSHVCLTLVSLAGARPTDSLAHTSRMLLSLTRVSPAQSKDLLTWCTRRGYTDTVGIFAPGQLAAECAKTALKKVRDAACAHLCLKWPHR